MNKGLLRISREQYEKGVDAGWNAFALAAFCGGYNISDDYFESDKQFFDFFKNWENEVMRIFAEECHNDPIIAAERMIAHTNRLRVENGMEPFEDEVRIK